MPAAGRQNARRGPGPRFRHAGTLACVLVCLLSWTASAGAQPRDDIGLRLPLDTLLDRREAVRQGTRVALHPDLHLRLGWMRDPIEPQYRYSPELETVYRIGGPAFVDDKPEYYLYDGAWYVYEPRSWDIPGIDLRATPRRIDQQLRLAKAERDLFRKRRDRGLGIVTEGGQDEPFQLKLLPALPGPLATILGRDETSITVSGRESISFAGQSRRVSPFIRSEQGRGQSLFPRLEMDQDLQVKLNGTIGGKVHVVVDHNSNSFGSDANRINIWYEGYEDDIVQRIDMGSTNLSIPGSRLVSFSGGSQGLFGVKTDLRLGGLDLTLVASKEETEAETRSLTPSGGSATATPIAENRYIRDQFFFYAPPDTNSLQFYDSYGLNPGVFDANDNYIPGVLLDENTLGSFRVFIDDQSPNTAVNRNYIGYAVEGLGAAQRGDTLQAWNTYLNHPAGDAARWPQVDPADVDGSYSPGRFRQLEDNEIGYVFYSYGNRRLVLGFYLRLGPLDSDDILAVAYDDPTNAALTVGSVQEVAGATPARLRLVRHPDQDSNYYGHPTSTYMMRHVYSLGARSITQLELDLVRVTNDPTPTIPDGIPDPGSTYLHMFGLDEVDQNNQPEPDGQFDQFRVNLWDDENGYLFLPGLRPFSPPAAVLLARVLSAGVDTTTTPIDLDAVFPPSERVPATMYTLPRNDSRTPSNHYRLEARVTAGEREIILPQDIIEGSEQVVLDGRTLQSGVDYDIEPFAGGRITLKGEALSSITPDSRIEVSYQYRPLFGGGQANLFGASARYKLGNRGQLATVWLFESRRGLSKRPRLGEEPTRTLVGDVNGSLRFEPRWMTGLMDLLPFTNTSAPSNLTFNGEAAMSLPNPNTENSAFVDDLENADTDDELPLSRRSWYWASIPHDIVAREDTLLRVPMSWYNPVGRVKRRDLNPLLDSREGDDGLTVLEVGFDRDHADNVTLPGNATIADMWSGIMTSFGTAGLDLTEAKSIEFWLNDARALMERRGRIHFDFGSVSEDFIFFPNNPSLGLTDEDFNREAETSELFLAQDDDRGFNGRLDACDTYDDGDQTTNLPPLDVDCHIPYKINAWDQFIFANGTEGNNQYDTEDINRNGRFDKTESFFRFSMDLDDVTWVTNDVQEDYGGQGLDVDPNNAWRKFRIDMSAILSQLEVITRRGASDPNLRQVRYLRVWFDDPEALDGSFFDHNIQLYGMKFTGNQWLQLGVFAVDSTSVVPELDETYSVSTINNKEDPSYVPPPVEIELNAEGIQSQEQSLRVVFDNLRPGHEMVLQRDANPGGRSIDITTYRRLKYWVHYPALSDSIEFFFRLGSDSLNFYEVAHTTPVGPSWHEINIDMDHLTGLRFPEDVPGSTFERIDLHGLLVQQIKVTMPDARVPSRTLSLTRRGEPSLKALSRLFIGVRHLDREAVADSLLGPGSPVSGEIWFNELSVDEVDREMGLAQSYAVSAKFADVLDASASYNVTDAEFRGLRQRFGSGSENISFSHRYSADVSRIIPTWGFSIPANYQYQKSLVQPKWYSSGDTRNTPEQQEEQRSESVRQSMGFTVSKRPSRFFLWKPTLDKLRFSYSRSLTENRAFTSRDTTVASTQNLTYDISPQARAFRIWKQHEINLMPTNIKLNIQHQQSSSQRYSVRQVQNLQTGANEDSLTRLASSPSRQLQWTGSTALRPLPNMTGRYNFSESRDYRQAHPVNQAERFKVLGFDFGLPTNRSENFALDLTPKLFRFGYASVYSDRRILNTTPQGEPLPDTHTLNVRRNRRLSFDFTLHRKFGNWSIFQQEPEPPPNPAAADSAAADSAAGDDSGGRPNPVKALFRVFGRIDPVRVELSDGLTTSYTGMTGEAQYPYRLGLTTDSGLPGSGVPSPVDRNNTVDLSTGVPIVSTVRLSTRYSRRWSERERRSDSGGVRIYRDPSVEETWPSVDVSLSNLHEWPFFGSSMRRSTLSVGMSRVRTTSSKRTYDGDENLLREDSSNTSERLNASGNWTASWGGDVATTFSVNRGATENQRVGQRVRSVTWRYQGSVRFKIQPQGGLKLPFVGTLRGGMDVSVSGNYNRDENRTFNNPLDPEDSILNRRTNSWSVSARSDYTLSRNLTGGMEVGFTRTAQNDNINQRISTLRLGFNLTFVF